MCQHTVANPVETSPSPMQVMEKGHFGTPHPYPLPATAGRGNNFAAGFSLLEVLIALVILSVGLLGIAAMISTSLKASDSSYIRSQATVLAYSIIDRMRANRSTAQVSPSPYDLSLPPGPPSTACNGSGAGCTGTQLADYDLSQWEFELNAMLPQGVGSITTINTAGPGGITTVSVTVQWNDSRAGNALKKTGAPTVTTTSLTVSSAL